MEWFELIIIVSDKEIGMFFFLIIVIFKNFV